MPDLLQGYPGCRANLLILFEAPQYAVVKAFVDSGECDSRDFENTGRGVKIALSVFENLAGGRIQARHVGEARR